MIAHYHYPLRYVMHTITCGQVFALFDAMGQYIKLTNPYGTEEDDKPASKPILGSDGKPIASKESEAPGAGELLSQRGFVSGISVGDRSHVPADIQDLL